VLSLSLSLRQPLVVVLFFMNNMLEVRTHPPHVAPPLIRSLRLRAAPETEPALDAPRVTPSPNHANHAAQQLTLTLTRTLTLP